MKSVEPKVFLVGETRIVTPGLQAYLEHVGAPEWQSDAPSDSELLCEVMGRLCYRSFKPGMNPNVTRVREGNAPYLANIVQVGHGSVLEHGAVNFIFADVSRVVTHELVRHRAGTAISQESLRFVRLDALSAYVPLHIRESEAGMEIFARTFEQLESIQRELARLYEIDEAGNLIGTLSGKRQNTNSIVIGSHLDSVSGGGIYDGSLGVIVGIAVCRALIENQIALDKNVEIIAFSDEEGSISGGTFGSRAMMGQLSAEEFAELQDPSAPLFKAFEKAGLEPEKIEFARRKLQDFEVYLELHIEQGAVLEDLNVQIGVVTGIVGINRYYGFVRGCANHGGTTPMHLRDDALFKASSFITELIEKVRTEKDAVITVGTIEVEPGAFNIIPNCVKIGIESRSLELKRLTEIEAYMEEKLTHLNGFLEIVSKGQAVKTDSKIQAVIAETASMLGYSFKHMPSGAGHDAVSFASEIPTGMIFIPSRGGLSHSPREDARLSDIEKGVNILFLSLLKIAGYE